MPQTFLEARQRRFLVACFDIDHTIGLQTGLRQRRREQVRPRQAPKDFPLGTRGDSGGEQGSRGAVDCTIAASRHLVQSSQRKAPAWEAPVDMGDPEWQDGYGAFVATFDLPDLVAQRLELMGRRTGNDSPLEDKTGR